MLPFRRTLLLLALLTTPILAQNPKTSSTPPTPANPKPEEQITVTQTKNTGTGEAEARQLLQQMAAAIGGPHRMPRDDYRLEGRTSTFFKNNPTGSTEYVLYHHPLAGYTYEDRVELTKKRNIVQIWTPTEGFELTFKGRQNLPEDDRKLYFQRQEYSLDALLTTWITDPAAILIDNGQSLVARRQARSITLINGKNESLTVDIETSTHLPIRRIFKVRDEKYRDFDEDIEEYSDWHTEDNVPVPFATTRYFNGDMVSQRFVTKIQFQPTDPSLFAATSPIGKHK